MTALATATESELLLYRVLQRANLTQYFEVFIQQGGDDIPQLCEAGEEEFLEIMALVGMASKPLHVRRLQKALQEWVTNPALFAKPIGPSTPAPPPASGSIMSSVARPLTSTTPPSGQNKNPVIPSSVEEANAPQGWIPKSENSWTPKTDSRSSSPNYLSSSSVTPTPISIQPITMNSAHSLVLTDTIGQPPIALPLYISEPAPMWKAPSVTNGTTGSIVSSLLDQSSRNSISPTPSTGSDTNNTNGHFMGLAPQIPVLTEQQMASIEMAAEALAKELPQYEAKVLNMKKETNREIIEVMNMPDDNPEKMTLLRKYSAIYGRFDSKRKNEGKMSLHEVSVNEASAQLCKRIPALLTRRDDLYPLSRRIVRDSGYQYSKGHSRASASMDIPPNKKAKIEIPKKSASFIPAQYELRVTEINKEINDIISHQEVLKSQISKAREENDQELLDSLRDKLEKCASRQLELRMEQSSIVGSSKTKNQKPSPKPGSMVTKPVVQVPLELIKRVMQSSPQKPMVTPSNQADNIIDLSCEGSNDNNVKQHSNSSSDGVLDLSATETNPTTNQKADLQESLLDEGLRIAQQYGMCDLAEEIKYMKDDSKEEVGSTESEIDEQEEWNREVERDLQKLKTPQKEEVTEKGEVNGKILPEMVAEENS